MPSPEIRVKKNKPSKTSVIDLYCKHYSYGNYLNKAYQHSCLITLNNYCCNNVLSFQFQVYLHVLRQNQ